MFISLQKLLSMYFFIIYQWLTVNLLSAADSVDRPIKNHWITIQKLKKLAFDITGTEAMELSGWKISKTFLSTAAAVALDIV